MLEDGMLEMPVEEERINCGDGVLEVALDSGPLEVEDVLNDKVEELEMMAEERRFICRDGVLETTVDVGPLGVEDALDDSVEVKVLVDANLLEELAG